MPALRCLLSVFVALSLSGCVWQSEDDLLQGYVEGDFLDIGAEETARLVSLDVQRGDVVDAAAVLFRLDESDAQTARGEAEAQRAQAKARLANIRYGKRREEIAVLEAQRDEIEASLEKAKRDFQRYETLHKAAVVSDANAEEAEEQVKTLTARLSAMRSQIDVARLAGRPEEIAAAEGAIDAATASIARIDARIDRLTGTAPMAGFVQDTYFEPGEVVPAGRPIVSLLPPDRFKVRFFVPQDRLAEVTLGGEVAVTCDGCGSPVAATVTFISEEVEFTPPVIYSVHARQKLVFMIEARPHDVTALKVGQPVDVELTP